VNGLSFWLANTCIPPWCGHGDECHPAARALWTLKCASRCSTWVPSQLFGLLVEEFLIAN
jgi:hypothetical protein